MENVIYFAIRQEEGKMQSDNVINVSIKEFLWSLLEQWKLLLLVGLAFAFLFPFVMFQKDKKAASERAASEAQYAGLSREEILNKLDDSSREAVLTAAYQANVISNLDDYNANTLMAHINLNNAETVHMKWVITGTDKTSELTTAYAAVLGDADTVKAVREALGPDYSGVKDVYISELVNAVAEDNSIDVFVFVPQGADDEALRSAVSDRIGASADSLGTALGDHSMVLIEDQTVFTNNLEMTEQILQRNNALQLLRETYEANLLTFSDLQLSVLNSLISGSEATAVVSSGEIPLSSAFTKGRLVIGCVIGIFIYVFASLMYVLFNSKLQSGDHLTKSYGIRLLGKNSRYGYKGIRILAHSKVFYNLHNKRYQGDDTVDSITASIIQSCRHNEIKKLAVVAVGGIRDEKRIKQFADKLKKDNSISVQLLKGAVADKDLENIDAAVFCVEKGVTSHKEISRVYELCKCYDCPVIGGICLV